MALYVFDGLSELILGNLLALYQSENALLEMINHEQDWQEGIYTKILSNSLWRLEQLKPDDEERDKEENKRIRKAFEVTQKLIKFRDMSKMEEVYESSPLESKKSLKEKQISFFAKGQHFDTSYELVMSTLDVELTDENEATFKEQVNTACDLVTRALEARAPIA